MSLGLAFFVSLSAIVIPFHSVAAHAADACENARTVAASAASRIQTRFAGDLTFTLAEVGDYNLAINALTTCETKSCEAMSLKLRQELGFGWFADSGFQVQGRSGNCLLYQSPIYFRQNDAGVFALSAWFNYQQTGTALFDFATKRWACSTDSAIETSRGFVFDHSGILVLDFTIDDRPNSAFWGQRVNVSNPVARVGVRAASADALEISWGEALMTVDRQGRLRDSNFLSHEMWMGCRTLLPDGAHFLPEVRFVPGQALAKTGSIIKESRP